MSFETRDLMVNVLPAGTLGAAALECTMNSPTPTGDEDEIEKKKKDTPACELPSCDVTIPPPKAYAMFQLPSLAALRQELQATLATRHFDAATDTAEQRLPS